MLFVKPIGMVKEGIGGFTFKIDSLGGHEIA